MNTWIEVLRKLSICHINLQRLYLTALNSNDASFQISGDGGYDLSLTSQVSLALPKRQGRLAFTSVRTNHCVCACMLSRVQLCVTSWTIAHQPPVSVGFPTNCSPIRQWLSFLCVSDSQREWQRLSGVWVLLRPLVSILPWVSMQYTLPLSTDYNSHPAQPSKLWSTHTRTWMHMCTDIQIKRMKSLPGLSVCSAGFDLHTVL